MLAFNIHMLSVVNEVLSPCRDSSHMEGMGETWSSEKPTMMPVMVGGDPGGGWYLRGIRRQTAANSSDGKASGSLHGLLAFDDVKEQQRHTEGRKYKELTNS